MAWQVVKGQPVTDWLVQLDSADEETRNEARYQLEKICYRPPGAGWDPIEDRVLLRNAGITDCLIAALHHGAPKAKSFAAARLGLLHEESALDGLIAALRDDNVEVRRAAASAFWSFHDRRAVRALIDAMRDSDEETAHHAARALGEIGDPEALSELLTWTKDRRWRRRQTSYRALGNIVEPQSLAACRNGLDDPKPQVRRAAKSGLAAFDRRRRYPGRRYPG